ncbi:hypothetical protein B0H14DRAFT_2583622 [Mycena olivaceomarginata]|nr:hypothetical protein B0H14DRAFT_2650005 [Mycena olivaceomarginata]KAJ7847343.1 hypothetical protein B0H14DRAFT_2583622 [Mycena olivaceomarginata]
MPCFRQFVPSLSLRITGSPVRRQACSKPNAARAAGSDGSCCQGTPHVTRHGWVATEPHACSTPAKIPFWLFQPPDHGVWIERAEKCIARTRRSLQDPDPRFRFPGPRLPLYAITARPVKASTCPRGSAPPLRYLPGHIVTIYIRLRNPASAGSGFLNLYPSLRSLPCRDAFLGLQSLGTYSVWFTCLKLFSLALEGSIEVCADTLNHLVFPPTPCLEITCCNTEAGLDMAFFPTLMETLANLLKNIPPAQKLRALGISWQSEALKFRASTDENGDVSPASEGSEFYLAFVSLTFPLTLAVLDALPTSDIAVLDFAVPLCQCPPPSHWIFRAEDDWSDLRMCS